VAEEVQHAVNDEVAQVIGDGLRCRRASPGNLPQRQHHIAQMPRPAGADGVAARIAFAGEGQHVWWSCRGRESRG